MSRFIKLGLCGFVLMFAALLQAGCKAPGDTPDPATPAPDPATPAPDPATPAPDPVTPAPDPVTPAPDPVTPAPDPVTPAPDPVTPAPDPVPEGKKPVSPHLVKVTFPPRQLDLQDVQVHKNPGGLLVVDVIWYNRLPSGTPFQYQVFWKDERGGVLSSADQGWRGTTMSKGRFPMRLVAKNNRAVDFRLTIERRK